MIEFRMMTPDNVVGRCLHGGPVPLDEAVSDGKENAYLVESASKYGAAGVMAINDGKLIGFLRFYPDEIFAMMSNQVCVHSKAMREEYQQIESLPSLDDLETRHLRIECIQVATGYYTGSDGKDYGGQGIGTQLIETMIEWAKDRSWSKILYAGVNPYQPVVMWSGFFPKDSLVSIGFDVISSNVSAPLKEGVSNQMEGHHGKDIKEMWSRYADVTADKAAELHMVELDL